MPDYEIRPFRWADIARNPAPEIDGDIDMRKYIYSPPVKQEVDPSPQTTWDRLMDNVRVIYEADVCIAGGAVRDHLLGIPPKDIDIFVNSDPAEAKGLAEELGWGEARRIVGEGYQRGNEEEGFDAFACLELRPQSLSCPVQLIFKTAEGDYPQALLQDFDLDICKSAYYNGEVIDTDPAKTDRETRTITFRGEGSVEKSHQRATRIQQRMSMFNLDFKLAGFKKMEDLLAEKKLKEEAHRKYIEELINKGAKMRPRWE